MIRLEKKEFEHKGFPCAIMKMEYANLKELKEKDLLLQGDKGQWLWLCIGLTELTEKQAKQLKNKILDEFLDASMSKKDETHPELTKNLFENNTQINHFLHFTMNRFRYPRFKENHQLDEKLCKEYMDKLIDMTLEKDFKIMLNKMGKEGVELSPYQKRKTLESYLDYYAANYYYKERQLALGIEQIDQNREELEKFDIKKYMRTFVEEAKKINFAINDDDIQKAIKESGRNRFLAESYYHDVALPILSGDTKSLTDDFEKIKLTLQASLVNDYIDKKLYVKNKQKIESDLKEIQNLKDSLFKDIKQLRMINNKAEELERDMEIFFRKNANYTISYEDLEKHFLKPFQEKLKESKELGIELTSIQFPNSNNIIGGKVLTLTKDDYKELSNNFNDYKKAKDEIKSIENKLIEASQEVFKYNFKSVCLKEQICDDRMIFVKANEKYQAVEEAFKYKNKIENDEKLQIYKNAINKGYELYDKDALFKQIYPKTFKKLEKEYENLNTLTLSRLNQKNMSR